MKIIKKLIELTKEKGNFNLEWNPHRSYYQTVKDYMEDYPDFLNFESKEEEEKAIEENTSDLVSLFGFIERELIDD
jgi:hypothetical protein